METSRIEVMTREPSNAVAGPPGARVWRIATLGDRLGRRTAVVVWLAAAIGFGLLAGWSWLVAAGLSTIVLGLLPCAAMCALGLCAGSSGKACSDKRVPTTPPEENN